MSSTEPTTSATGETSTSPPPTTASSEINAVPAGDASKEKEKRKSSAKGPRKTPSITKTVAGSVREDGEGGKDEAGARSDAESEYETICIRRKKPTPIVERLRRFLGNYIAFDVYMATVLWEALKILVITSQFNWAIEILAGVLHILVSAGRCALKKKCSMGPRKKLGTPETDTEKTPAPGQLGEKKKSSVKSISSGSKPGGKPSLTKSPSKMGSSEPPTESTEQKTSETGPTSTEGETATSPTASSG